MIFPIMRLVSQVRSIDTYRILQSYIYVRLKEKIKAVLCFVIYIFVVSIFYSETGSGELIGHSSGSLQPE